MPRLPGIWIARSSTFITMLATTILIAYHYVRDGEATGRTIRADTLKEITEAYLEEEFFAYEAENGNRLAWRIRGRIRRRLWAAEYRRREAKDVSRTAI